MHTRSQVLTRYPEPEAVMPVQTRLAVSQRRSTGIHIVATNDRTTPVYQFADPSNGWLPASAVMSYLPAASTIRIRFHFKTVTNEANEYPGFYVDDVRLQALLGEGEGEGEWEATLPIYKGHRWFPLFDTDDYNISAENRVKLMMRQHPQKYLRFRVMQPVLWSFDNIVVNGYLPGSGYNLDAPYVAGPGQPDYRHWGECQGN